MPVTRINNNQISDASAGNVYLGIDASTKLQDYSVTSGKIANNLTYGSDLTVSGNLTVQGNTTTIDTVNVVIEDPLILLADAQTGSPTLDIGFIGKRGTETNITFVWDESQDKFVAAFTDSEITNTTVNITSYASFMAGNLATTAGGNLIVDGPTTLTGNATVGNFFVDTNKTIDVGNNRISNAANPVANSDVATKAYVDSQSASGFTIQDDTANTTVVSGGDTLQLLGTTNEVTVAITATDQITFGLPNDVVVTGNLDAANINATTNVTGTTFTASGNVNANNAVITNDVSTTTLTASGNVSGSNLNATASVVATGNISGNNAIITNLVQGTTVTATGNVNGGNVISSALVQGVTVTATGNLNGNNAVITNDVSATTISASGNVLAGNVNSNASVTGVTGTFSGNVDANNMISTNLVQGATVTATGNVNGNNVVATNNVNAITVTASGNLNGNNAVITNDVSTTTLTASGNVLAGNVNSNASVTGVTGIFSGNVNMGNATATGNINAGNLISSGAVIGNIEITGNIDVVNVNASGNLNGNNAVITNDVSTATLSASGNVLAGNVNSNAAVTGVTGTFTGNIDANNVIATNLVQGTTVTATGNLTGNNAVIANNVNATNLIATANVNGANLNTTTAVYTPNISGATLTVTTTSGNVLFNVAGGMIDMGGTEVHNVATPTDASDAATKEYVDNAVSTGITIHTPVYLETPIALSATYAQGGTTATVTDTIAGNTVVFSSAINPQVNDQYWFTNSFNGIVANTAYFVVSAPNTSAAVLSTTYNGLPVTNISNGTGLTQAVRVNSGIGATLTGNVNGALIADGITPSVNDRILVYNQTPGYENGVYVVTDVGNISAPFILTRSSDTNIYAPESITALDAGDYFFVQAGNTGAGESYVMTAPIGPFIIGYDSLTFTQFSASSTYSANTNAGLVLNGTIFSAKVDNDTTAFGVGGNIIVKAGANLITPNIGDATGNSLTLSGNGLLSATTVEATGNVLAGNVNSNAAVTGVTGTFTGNISGNNITSTNLVQGTTVTATGNVNGGNVISSALVQGVTVTATGNLNGNNAVITNDVSASTVSATGNVNGGNLNSTASVTGITGTFSGNVDANNMISTNLVQGTTVTATGNVNGNNVIATNNVEAITVTASGNLNGNNAVITNDVSATTISASGNVLAGNVNSNAAVTGVTGTFSGNVDANNMISTNLVQGTTVTATGNVNGGNVISTALVSGVTVTATGNLNGNNAVISNDVSTTTLTATGNVSAGNVISTNLIQGTTVTATGNLNGNNATITGNVSAGNVEALSGNVSASGGYFTGNVTAQYFIGDVIGNIAGNIDAGGANTQIQFNDNDVLAGSAAFTFNKTSNLVTAFGNISAGNLIAGTNVEGATVTASGNVNANNAVVTNDVGASTGTFSTSVKGGNITISSDSIDGSNGIIIINDADADTDFAVNGDTVANVFYVDAGTGTASFGNSTQTTGALVAFNATNTIVLPVGNTAQRPTGVTGMFRYNTTEGTIEWYDGTQWEKANSDFTVIVDDKFTGDGSTTTFTLSQNSTTAGTIVTINGVVQIPTTAYSVTGNSLAFTEAPEVSDTIDARILTTTASVNKISGSGGAQLEAGTGLDFLVTGDLIPTANVTYDLGNSTNWWNNGWFSGTTIHLGGLQLKASGNTFAVYTADGVTQANIDAGAIDVSSISSGTSVIGISGVNGNAYITVGGTANVLTVSQTSANVTGALGVTGNVTGSYFFGNGSQLTGIDATSIQNGTANVKTILNGNVTISAAGQANVVVVTSTGANITGTLNATGNANVGNLGATTVVATNVGGTLTTAAQPNITSVGTLTGLTVSGSSTLDGVTVSGNTISSAGTTLTLDPSAPGATGLVVIAGNLQVNGTTTTIDSTTVTINDLVFTVANNAATSSAANGGGLEVGPPGSPYATWTYDQPNSRWSTALGIVATGNITGGNLSGTNVAGTLTTAAQPNITSVGTLGSLTVTGNVSTGNISGTTGTFTNVAGTLTTAAQPNITSVGTLSSLTVTGNITGGNLSVSTGTVTLGSIVNANGNGVGNIGSATTYFNTVFAKATSAQYADLAEMYEADQILEPGTVVAFGGAKEVTTCGEDGSRRVAGVVSTNPSYIMNAGLAGDNVVAVALTGRVPTKVTGTIRKGDMLVAAGNGRARAEANPAVGAVIGKALADFDGAEGVIEVVVGRL